MLTYNLEFQDMESFIALHNYKSFTKASEKLYITQSALSRRIKTLEEELGVELVVRTKHGVDITDAGKAFYKYCLKMLREKDSIYISMNRFRNGETGALRIASDPVIGIELVIKIIAKFSRQYPKVQISYESVQDIDTRRYLLENSVDVVLSYLNAVENLPELDYTVIGENELLVSVGSNHPYFHRSSLTWEELRGQKLVIPGSSNGSEVDRLFNNGGVNSSMFDEIVIVKDPNESVAYTATGKYISFGGVVGSKMYTFLPEYVRFIPVVEGENRLGWPVLAYKKDNTNPFIQKLVDTFKNDAGDDL